MPASHRLSARCKVLFRRNCQLLRQRWPQLIGRETVATLRTLTEQFHLSIAMGDLLILEGGWYVTHSGLLRLARRHHCQGIHVAPVIEFSNAAQTKWVFKATVYKTSRCRGFVGYGDADPANTSAAVRGAELRVAETRAVNRALRKAYGIGICSVEERGSFAGRYRLQSVSSRQQADQNGPMATTITRYVIACVCSSGSTSSIPPS